MYCAQNFAKRSQPFRYCGLDRERHMWEFELIVMIREGTLEMVMMTDESLMGEAFTTIRRLRHRSSRRWHPRKCGITTSYKYRTFWSMENNTSNKTIRSAIPKIPRPLLRYTPQSDNRIRTMWADFKLQGAVGDSQGNTISRSGRSCKREPTMICRQISTIWSRNAILMLSRR